MQTAELTTPTVYTFDEVRGRGVIDASGFDEPIVASEWYWVKGLYSDVYYPYCPIISYATNCF